ncbi:MAG TPA: response regulator [Longimicrobium sp.]
MSEPGAASVLVVDDLPEQREIYRAMLRHAGMRVLEAHNGETAVDLARAHVPAVVLLDVRLPDIDGFEVMRRLRAEPRTRQIPVLLLTATSVPEDRLYGFAELLTKPVPPRDALAAVRRHLSS